MQQTVLISGASGLIGTALSDHLRKAGFAVHKLARDNPEAQFNYSSESKRVTLDDSIHLDAVVNLAGPSIADGRWTDSRKRFCPFRDKRFRYPSWPNWSGFLVGITSM